MVEQSGVRDLHHLQLQATATATAASARHLKLESSLALLIQQRRHRPVELIAATDRD